VTQLSLYGRRNRLGPCYSERETEPIWRLRMTETPSPGSGLATACVREVGTRVDNTAAGLLSLIRCHYRRSASWSLSIRYPEPHVDHVECPASG